MDLGSQSQGFGGDLGLIFRSELQSVCQRLLTYGVQEAERTNKMEERGLHDAPVSVPPVSADWFIP